MLTSYQLQKDCILTPTSLTPNAACNRAILFFRPDKQLNILMPAFFVLFLNMLNRLMKPCSNFNFKDVVMTHQWGNLTRRKNESSHSPESGNKLKKANFFQRFKAIYVVLILDRLNKIG